MYSPAPAHQEHTTLKTLETTNSIGRERSVGISCRASYEKISRHCLNVTNFSVSPYTKDRLSLNQSSA